MICGFIGTGTITEAIVAGMMASPLDIAKIVVSPRNAEVAARLAARFAKVEVAVGNQAVADSADVLFLAVRPQVAEAVLKEISVPPGRKIISLIAATDHDALAAWIGHQAQPLVRAIPLPFVADRDGVTAIFPPDDGARTIFDALGTAVACETQGEFDLLAAASAMMGTYFGILERATEWLAGRGMDETKARSYLVPLFGSLARVAAHAPEASFTMLRQEFSTRGGLNEQVFSDFDKNGGSRALTDALSRVLERIRK